jgi:hypothetical protein
MGATDEAVKLRCDAVARAADGIRNARSKRAAARVDGLKRAAAALREGFDRAGQAARGELEIAIQKHRRLGWPPSFVQLAGVSDLEKPFNRLLAWWARNADHAMGYRFLIELARAVSLPVLASDIERGSRVDVFAEETIEGDESGKQPDLVVRTENAALLLENKVHAGESGEGQYARYLEILRSLADTREYRAVLCAREPREAPLGYSPSLTHANLGRIFRVLAEDTGAPFWGRVSAVVCAVAFENDGSIRGRLEEAEALLHRTAEGPIGPSDLMAMRAIINLPDPPVVSEADIKKGAVEGI